MAPLPTLLAVRWRQDDHRRTLGTRCVLTLATELAEREARYGCLGICAGSGQGIAVVLERT
jgi:hypothetical protein